MARHSRDVRSFFTIVGCSLAGLLLLIAPGCVSHTRLGRHAYDRGDYATALAEWTPIAEQGDADVQFFVGLMHDEGQGVEADPAMAAHWYRLAADQGDAASQNNLGALHLAGRGVERSTDEAAAWFARAAAQGFARAQHNLAVLQLFGQAPQDDPARTAALLRHAAVAGDVKAQSTLGTVHETGLGIPADADEAAR